MVSLFFWQSKEEQHERNADQVSQDRVHEHRNEHCYVVNSNGRLDAADGMLAIHIHICSLSAGGVGFYTDAEIEPGSRWYLTLDLEEKSVLSGPQIEIVYCTPYQGQYRAGAIMV